jgi:hypothetical protein
MKRRRNSSSSFIPATSALRRQQQSGGSFCSASELLASSAAAQETGGEDDAGSSATAAAVTTRMLPAVVVGMANYVGWRKAAAGDMVAASDDLEITFEREPENQHDPNAVRVLLAGRQMGYLQRRLAYVLSPLVAQRELRLLPLTLKPAEARVLRLQPDGCCSCERLIHTPNLPAPGAFPIGLKVEVISHVGTWGGGLGSTAGGLQASRQHALLDLLDGLVPDCGAQSDELPPIATALPPPPHSRHCEATPGLAVLSLFSGIGADLLAMQSARIPCRVYAASEVEQAALAVAGARPTKLIGRWCRSLGLRFPRVTPALVVLKLRSASAWVGQTVRSQAPPLLTTCGWATCAA